MSLSLSDKPAITIKNACTRYFTKKTWFNKNKN